MNKPSATGVLKVLLFALCLVPFLLLGWRAFRQNLGANPIEFITHATGDWTLRFLLITLGVTPLRMILGRPQLIRYRRMLGLFAFFYGCLHFLTFIWLDKFFDMADILKDVAKRPFITAGFTAFVLLIPLAITSTKGWVRRLGGKRWQRLHRLIYFSAAAAVVHYYWLVKSDVRLPLLYGAILSLLLLYRIVKSRKLARLVARPAALALFAVATFAQSPRFFIQMSDPQFGMYAEDRNFEQETANFEFFVANANRLHPMFVVACGDQVNRAGDADQIAEYKRIARTLDRAIPLYNVPGNHDVGNDPTPESVALYRKNFGPDYYTFPAGDFTGIVLDSSLIKAPAKAPDEARKQKQWLEAELGKVAPGRAIVFQHHPYFLEDPDEADQYFNIPKETRARYLALFRKFGVKYIFAGHYHRNAFGRDGELQMITTGPVGKPIGPDPSGFRIVVMNGATLEQRYYGLGTIPNKVPQAN